MMDDLNLDGLKHISPPPPSARAKRDAMHAACEAFGNACENKKQKKFQGFAVGARLIHSINEQLWSFIMKKQLIAGTAFASILAVMMTIGVMNGQDLIRTKEKDSNRKEGSISHQVPPQADSVMRFLEENELVAPPSIQLDSPPAAQQQDFAALTKTLESQPKRPSVAKRAVAPIPSLPHASLAQTANDSIAPMPVVEGRDQFEDVTPNPVKLVSEEPVSTFSVDVDTASYAFMRRAINNGRLPQKNAVRVEELINYFDYNYPLPDSAERPFEPTVNIYPTPWNKGTKLMHIGIQGHDIVPAEKPSSNLVFLLDVSGSMHSADKLPLLKNAFKLMVENLSSEDTVSIVTYAGRAGTVLEPTKVAEKGKIIVALEGLQSGGSTAGAQGIEQAYALAERNFDKEGVNRVILATDGDFNVGTSDREELKGYIERKRESGIFLSVLGFGQGNYNDALMQKLAQNGNGNAAYIDTLSEARKVLVEEASSTLFPIAKDVKLQVEFNPNTVAEYRLIGYETRALNREDFNNDKVDAGDIGSGHTVTAIYEITPVGSDAKLVDELRYQQAGDAAAKASTAKDEEYAFLKLRYKLPDEDASKLIKIPVTPKLESVSIAEVSEDVRFATSVAAFGQLLRGESYLKGYSYEDVLELAKSARGDDEFGYRSEFMNLVRLAMSAKKM